MEHTRTYGGCKVYMAAVAKLKAFRQERINGAPNAATAPNAPNITSNDDFPQMPTGHVPAPAAVPWGPATAAPAPAPAQLSAENIMAIAAEVAKILLPQLKTMIDLKMNAIAVVSPPTATPMDVVAATTANAAADDAPVVEHQAIATATATPLPRLSLEDMQTIAGLVAGLLTGPQPTTDRCTAPTLKLEVVDIEPVTPNKS